jgi:hypothetical protein
MSDGGNKLPTGVASNADHVVLDVTAALRNPDLLSRQTVCSIVWQAGKDALTVRRALAALGTVLLLAPKLGRYVPGSFLRQCRRQEPRAWKYLALIMLHTDGGEETRQLLQSALKEDDADDATWHLLQHLCDWFPERVDGALLAYTGKRNGFSPHIVKHQESRMFREQSGARAVLGSGSVLSSLFGQDPRVLAVHNIADGQGDEMIRMYALLQALLDGFPTLEITLFTDRLYLYDHPRLHPRSISDADSFSEALRQPWDGILNFFEPYLPSNSYNPTVQLLLEEHLRASMPGLLLAARKDVNHFVFESLRLNGQELAPRFGITRRLLPLNYEITMRLITCLGLPLRVGEDQPLAGPIQTTNPQPNLARAWQDLTAKLTVNGQRSIALVNVFGGQNPMKGFTPPGFERLAQILQHLVEEGYGLVLVPNGGGWGGADAIEAVRDCLDPPVRSYTIAAPILPNAQENMRQLKYFVAWSDLVVTIEGWMMHLAYALGKPFRLLMAPYSSPSEWHPHGRSKNQGLWIPPSDRSLRRELALPSPAEQVRRPPPICYPEKAMLEAAFELWAITADRRLGESLGYWMGSDDKDIRKWAVTARGRIDPIYFQDELIQALADSDHCVRAAAATALLDSGQDLTPALSADWRAVLHAYQLVGKCRFRDALSLGRLALPALRACLAGEDEQVARDAAIVLGAHGR